MNPKFVNAKGLSEATGVPVLTLRTLYRQRKISGIKAGHRTLLFDKERVVRELEKFTISAVS
jgi:hypothetical protein